MTQCEWILYESGHEFFMKASQILYQTVTDFLQCWGSPLQRTENGNYRHVYGHVLLENVSAVYLMLITCVLIVFKQTN